MIAVTIGVGKWRKAADLAAAAARKHTGLETRVLGDQDWKRYRAGCDCPPFLKLHLFDLVPADNILYFDADAIHINPWNPAEFANQHALVAAVDPYIGWWAGEADVRADEYFNSGVMILNRGNHERLLQMARALAVEGLMSPWLMEQPHLNKARKLCGIPLHALPSACNHMRFYNDPHFNPRQSVIAHWTPHQRNDLRRIEKFAATGAFSHESKPRWPAFGHFWHNLFSRRWRRSQ